MTASDSEHTDARQSRANPWWLALAERLATPEGLHTARTLQREGFFDAAEQPPATRPPLRVGPQPISIWQPRMDGSALVFERPDPQPMGT